MTAHDTWSFEFVFYLNYVFSILKISVVIQPNHVSTCAWLTYQGACFRNLCFAHNEGSLSSERLIDAIGIDARFIYFVFWSEQMILVFQYDSPFEEQLWLSHVPCFPNYISFSKTFVFALASMHDSYVGNPILFSHTGTATFWNIRSRKRKLVIMSGWNLSCFFQKFGDSDTATAQRRIKTARSFQRMDTTSDYDGPPFKWKVMTESEATVLKSWGGRGRL